MGQGRGGTVADMREGGAGPAEPGDPAAAFEALQSTVEGLAAVLGREMTTIRRGVEAALARSESQDAPADYGPDLGRIVQQLAVVGERLQAVEQAPALRQGVEHDARLLESRTAALVRTTIQDLERKAEADDGARRMRRMLRRQDHWLVGVGGAAFVLGIQAVLFLPRVLPSSVGLSAAATVLGADRWTAGSALMQTGSPGGWRAILDAHALVSANQEALTACREAAAKAGKEQRCTLIVPVSPK